MGHESPKAEVPPRLTERLKVLVASYPHIAYRQGDRRQEARIEFVRGAIRDVRGQDPESPVYVPTDTGLIVEADREVGTDRMWGCAALLIRHPRGKLFAHLTPTNRLAYMDWDEKKDQANVSTVDHVIEALRQAGLSLEECEGVLIGNMGTASGKYKRERLLQIWEDFGQRLKAAGLARWKVKEVPLDETMIFHTPDKPNKVLVMGHPAKLEEGNFLVDQKATDELWVEL